MNSLYSQTSQGQGLFFASDIGQQNIDSTFNIFYTFSIFCILLYHLNSYSALIYTLHILNIFFSYYSAHSFAGSLLCFIQTTEICDSILYHFSSFPSVLVCCLF